MASFEVQVVNDDQDGVGHARVALEFRGITRGMSTAEYTDSSGSAYFDGYEEGEVEVYIDGKSYGRYDYSDGDCITITI